MSRKVYYMTECPESATIYKSASYGTFTLALLPYLLFWLLIDYPREDIALGWFDIAYHVLNFLAVGIIFFGFLRDAFLEVQIHTGKVLKAAGIGALLMLVLAFVLTFVMTFAGVLMQNQVLKTSMLPMTENVLFCLSGWIVQEQPIFGTATVVILVPITISCLFYATVFAPVYNKWPAISYVVLAVVLAIPRIVYALTFWDWFEELIVYLTQLPIHLIACTIYKKTDTIWTPIFALMAANAVMCAFCLI